MGFWRAALLFGLAAVVSAPQAAIAQSDAKSASPAVAPPVSAGEIKPVALTRMVMKLEPGQTYAKVQDGMFCDTVKTVSWNGGSGEETVAIYQDVFREKMLAAGLKVQGSSDDLFDAPAASTDYALAGLITNLNVRICAPNRADASKVKGEVSMDIQWELYSRLEHRMLATVRTTADYQRTSPDTGGFPAMSVKAVGANLEELARSPEFRQALTGPARGAGDLITSDAQAHIALAGSLAAPARTVDETVGSVVTIALGSGTGSGVLVSNDGYILTAAHVVEDAQEVKVRWSDGLETVGKVVRSFKGRDVALVKSEGRGRDPVPIRQTPAQVGETVYAIGSPLGEKLQGTVTRGVVSSKRIVDGFAYIQSDVTVNRGNSGGPLLDDKGRLLGLTKGNIAIGGIIPTGLNFFIPASDALDFLALDQR